MAVSKISHRRTKNNCDRENALNEQQPNCWGCGGGSGGLKQASPLPPDAGENSSPQESGKNTSVLAPRRAHIKCLLREKTDAGIV